MSVAYSNEIEKHVADITQTDNSNIWITLFRTKQQLYHFHWHTRTTRALLWHQKKTDNYKPLSELADRFSQKNNLQYILGDSNARIIDRQPAEEYI